MRIKLYSPYHHFPNHVAVDGEPYIPCYNDNFVRVDDIEPNAIALLIEPRPLQPKVYKHIEQHYDRFKYVFTHDSILLKTLPNAKLIIWGGVYDWADEPKDFNHPISMVASWKEEAPVRIMRKHLAMELKDKIDCYGTFDGGEYATTHDIYAKYPFSVVIENHIDEYWLTEKVCNCFAMRTIPIYWGARHIKEFFNPDGILFAHGIEDIKGIVNNILEMDPVQVNEMYMSRICAINENEVRVKKFANFEDWFFRTYGELLEGIKND